MAGDEVTDTDEMHRRTTTEIPRRHLLKGAAVGGAILLGSGTATADGQGGQGIVYQEDYDSDATFVINAVSEEECDALTPDGSCREEPLPFRCDGKGGRYPPGKDGRLPFPWWWGEYESGDLEGQQFKLYTRDNSIKTGITYRWTRKEKECPETPGVYQVGFTSDEK